ncbi:hypothetical protein B0H13DRAFT_1902983 [Mycena leptocephala]|nr:hypothetical protein B0H13DRAFT_1902983 [Mycena leptocephala]
MHIQGCRLLTICFLFLLFFGVLVRADRLAPKRRRWPQIQRKDDDGTNCPFSWFYVPPTVSIRIGLTPTFLSSTYNYKQTTLLFNYAPAIGRRGTDDDGHGSSAEATTGDPNGVRMDLEAGRNIRISVSRKPNDVRMELEAGYCTSGVRIKGLHIPRHHHPHSSLPHFALSIIHFSTMLIRIQTHFLLLVLALRVAGQRCRIFRPCEENECCIGIPLMRQCVPLVTEGASCNESMDCPRCASGLECVDGKCSSATVDQPQSLSDITEDLPPVGL